MTLVPQTPGFPSAAEPRNSPPYSLGFQPPGGAEDTSQRFEKLFAEFLADVGKREAGEKAAGSARDQEFRAREAAAELKAAETRTRQGREADARRETEAARDGEAAHEAGVRGTAAVPQETAGTRTGEAAAGAVVEAAADGSGAAPEGIAAAPEGDPGDPREERPPLEAWVPGFRGPYESLSPAGQPGEETAGGQEGRRAPSPAERAEAVPPREDALPQAGAPAKRSAASAKNRAAPNAGTPENTASPKKAGTLQGDSPVPQGTAPVPEQGAEILDSPGDPGRFDGGAIRTAFDEAGTDTLRYSILADQKGIGESLSRLSVSALGMGPGKGTETERPGTGGREVRGNSRRRVDLRDYRERSPQEVSPGPGPVSPGPLEAKLHPEALPRDLLPADLNPQGGGERAVPAGGNAGTFEEVLTRELHHHLNGDIVRHAQIILRDKGEGVIRLSLKPESLGNVKIRLELTENKIAGHIIVESGEALRAFEREIASLEQSFRDSGYESAELNAFLAQDGRGSGGGGAGEGPFYSPRFAADRAASRYDETLERTDTSLSEDSEKGLLPGNRRVSVNMLI